MEQLPMGRPPAPDAARDAVHVAIAPVVAETQMMRAQRIRVDGTHARAVSAAEHANAIVDPWITNDVEAGELVWVLMNPGTITAIRHHWQHPDVRDVPDEARASAIAWLKEEVCDPTSRSLQGVLEDAIRHAESDGGFKRYAQSGDGEDATIEDLPDLYAIVETERFWQCVNILAGTNHDLETVPYECCV